MAIIQFIIILVLILHNYSTQGQTMEKLSFIIDDPNLVESQSVDILDNTSQSGNCNISDDSKLFIKNTTSVVLEPRQAPVRGQPTKKRIESKFTFSVGGACYDDSNTSLSVRVASNISSVLSCSLCSNDINKVITNFYWRISSRKQINSQNTSRVKMIPRFTFNCSRLDLNLINVFSNDTGAVECLINITNNMTRQHITEFSGTRNIQVHLTPQVILDPLPEFMVSGEILRVSCLVEIYSSIKEIITIKIGTNTDTNFLPPYGEASCHNLAPFRQGAMVFRLTNTGNVEFFSSGPANVCMENLTQKEASFLCSSMGLANDKPLISRFYKTHVKNGYSCFYDQDQNFFQCSELNSCSSGWIRLNCAAWQYKIDNGETFSRYFNASIVICSEEKNINIHCSAENSIHMINQSLKSVQVQKSYEKDKCDSEKDVFGKWWPLTMVNMIKISKCPDGMEGTVQRFCDRNRNWQPADYSQCTRNSIKEILLEITMSPQIYRALIEKVFTVLQYSLSEDSIPLSSGDFENILQIFNCLEFDESLDATYFAQTFVNLLNGILHPHLMAALEKYPKVIAVSLMKAIENLGDKIAKKSKNDLQLITENVEFSVRKLKRGDKFDILNGSFYYADINEDFVHSIQTENVTLSSLFYKTFSKVLPVSNDMSIASGILSLSLHPIPNKTWSNLVLMHHKNIMHFRRGEPVCNYWDFSQNSTVGGWWNTNGCKLVDYSPAENSVQCICDHMTNFAVLMGRKAPPFHDELLGMLTIVGCSASILCLFITIVSHVWIWKSVSSIRTILLLNLSGSMLLAMLVFVTGIIKTENVIVCQVIAILLHYLYLVVFFFMLCHGLLLYILLVRIFNSGINLNWHFILLGWGLPLIIVGITMATRQLDGYGTKEYCWLSQENGMIYAFIIPAALVILANLIFITMALKSMIRSAGIQTDSEKEKIRSVLWNICLLLPLLGFTWICGLLAIIDESLIFNYLFVGFNSFQGVLIFVFYCLRNPRIQQCLRDTCKGSDRPLISKDKYVLAKMSGDSASTTVSLRKKSSTDGYS